MSKTDKLIQKLRNGSIDARELRTLMKQLGWEHARTNGSHETWICGSGVMTLATHSNDLKPYQIKAAQKHVLGDEK